MKETYERIHIRNLLDDKDYDIIKPIPVILEQRKEDNCYFARSGELGITCPGVGETSEEACKELIKIILAEADSLMNSKRKLRGNDIYRLNKMQEYLAPKSKASD